MELVIAPQQERVVMALTTAVRQALEATQPAPVRDPLRSYRLLQEASDQKYQLTSQSLREILEVAQSTVNSWPAEMSRNGFLLRRMGPGRWRVSQEVVDG
jgi:predicted transcriptional regulator of viral defense system